MSQDQSKPPFTTTGGQTDSTSQPSSSSSVVPKQEKSSTSTVSNRIDSCSDASGSNRKSSNCKTSGNQQITASVAQPNSSIIIKQKNAKNDEKNVVQTEQVNASEQTDALAPGPPPETTNSGKKRRNNRHPARSNGAQVIRVPSLRGPTGPANFSPGQFGTYRGSGHGRNVRGYGPIPSQFAPPPPLGAQSYQHWARPNYGPRPNARTPPGNQTFVGRDMPQSGPLPFSSSQVEPSVGQSILWIRNLMPFALEYFEANPDVDQALGLVIYRVCQGFFTPPSSNIRGGGLAGKGPPAPPSSNGRINNFGPPPWQSTFDPLMPYLPGSEFDQNWNGYSNSVRSGPNTQTESAKQANLSRMDKANPN